MFLWASIAGAQSYVDVSVEEGHTMWQGGVFVLDVRTAAEFRAGHIPGALNIDVAELPDRLDEIADLADDDILVYCKKGGRSASASAILAGHAFTGVHNMLGGFDAWKTAGYEEEASNPGYDDVTLENAHRLFQGGAQMLDVRSPFLFRMGHIAGAHNIDSDSLADRLDEIADWQDLDIVVYCSSEACGLSDAASAVLADNGFTRVHNMAAGYEDWANAGYDTENDLLFPPLSCHATAAPLLPPGKHSGDGLVLLASFLALSSLSRAARGKV